MKLSLITSYSNLQLRLGYLKIVAALGTRFPTTQQLFEDKLAKLFPAPPPKKGHGLGLALQKQPAPPSYIEKQFLDLGVRRGILNKANISEIVSLAKAFGFIDPENCALFEIAVVVQSMMGKQAVTAVIEQNAEAYNPLIIGHTVGEVAEKALFMILTLRADLMTAILACAVADQPSPFHLYEHFPSLGTKLFAGVNAVKTSKSKRRSTFNFEGGEAAADGELTPYAEKNMLLGAFRLAESWVKQLGSRSLAISNWNGWRDYFLGDSAPSPFGGKPEYRMGKRSSYRHHAAPRFEFLVDMDLLQRGAEQSENISRDGDSDSGYFYQTTATTLRFTHYLETHLQPNLDVEKFVRERAIDCCAETYGLSLETGSEAEQVRFLVKGFQAVKREIGSTPMWTAALMSSLLALREKIRIEIGDFYALAKKLSMAEGAKVRLSGGSRFDGEFLITIAPDFIKATLQSDLKS
jgi:hypothetical protein